MIKKSIREGIGDLKQFLETAEQPLIAVVGPTASGKTKLAVEIAKAFDGEVINADSRQIYAEMKIGNERTKPEEMEGIPHHLLGTVSVTESYNVSDYKRDAEQLIDDIRKRGKRPILCGGTFMWVDAVVDNFQIPAGEPNMSRREELEAEDTNTLLQQLRAFDLESANELEKTRNKRYIVRALEIYEQTGIPKSQQASKGERQYDVYKVAPYRDREEIYRRINERTAWQLDHGMIEEVQAMVDQFANGDPSKLLGLSWPGVTSIGCKEVVPFLMGEIDKEQLLQQLQQNNRNYAKRQLTWLRKDEEVHWLG